MLAYSIIGQLGKLLGVWVGALWLLANTAPHGHYGYMQAQPLLTESTLKASYMLLSFQGNEAAGNGSWMSSLDIAVAYLLVSLKVEMMFCWHCLLLGLWTVCMLTRSTRCRHMQLWCFNVLWHFQAAVYLLNITKGLCKVKKFQKSKQIGYTLPQTHTNFFLETHHWHGQNTQIIITLEQLLSMYLQTEYIAYGILPVTPNISTGLELFWDDFPQKNSEWDLDPPTHFHSNLGFFVLCTAPKWCLI